MRNVFSKRALQRGFTRGESPRLTEAKYNYVSWTENGQRESSGFKNITR